MRLYFAPRMVKVFGNRKNNEIFSIDGDLNSLRHLIKISAVLQLKKLWWTKELIIICEWLLWISVQIAMPKKI